MRLKTSAALVKIVTFVSGHLVRLESVFSVVSSLNRSEMYKFLGDFWGWIDVGNSPQADFGMVRLWCADGRGKSSTSLP